MPSVLELYLKSIIYDRDKKMQKMHILKCLQEIEQKYRVHVLMAVESGSRAIKTTSDNCIYIRFLVLH